MNQIEEDIGIICEAMEYNSKVQFSLFLKPLLILNEEDSGEIIQVERLTYFINLQRKLFRVVYSKGVSTLIKFQDAMSLEKK
ncbi:hypothetical protein ABEO83_07995 [Bacillus glycinifermentans]|uniref:hypothetical protein n=1 Tax=Bacillus glycinifermentans TaxID=1664069 RepID=UPI003D1E9714